LNGGFAPYFWKIKMNKEEIIRMAHEAGAYTTKQYPDEFRMDANDLERFVNLAAAAEREACAKLCDAEINPEGYDKFKPITQYQSGRDITAQYLANEIRARVQHD
jgi:hypothetical protein